MITMIEENHDYKLEDDDSPLIELASAHHHDFHQPGSRKPNQPVYLQFLQLCQVFVIQPNISKCFFQYSSFLFMNAYLTSFYEKCVITLF